jgi:predicted RNA-binding protein Jag
MQYINVTLMTAAINIIKKIRDDKDVDLDNVTNEFRKIIHTSVEQYTLKV